MASGGNYMNKSKFMTYFMSLAAAILLLFSLYHLGDIKDAFLGASAALGGHCLCLSACTRRFVL